MLPKLRLVLATIAAAVAVLALGLGLFSASRNASVFAIGLRSAKGSPIERSLPEPPDWRQFAVLAAMRRTEELKALLDLPSPSPPSLTADPASAAGKVPESAVAPIDAEPMALIDPSSATEGHVAAAAAWPTQPPGIQPPTAQPPETPVTDAVPLVSRLAAASEPPQAQPVPAEPARSDDNPVVVAVSTSDPTVKRPLLRRRPIRARLPGCARAFAGRCASRPHAQRCARWRARLARRRSGRGARRGPPRPRLRPTRSAACSARALSAWIESESALALHIWSHFRSENRCPLFRKML